MASHKKMGFKEPELKKATTTTTTTTTTRAQEPPPMHKPTTDGPTSSRANERGQTLCSVAAQMTLLLVTIVALSPQACQSALLTNIYGGKRLSEITDISHRFLLLPSPATKYKREQQQQQQLDEDQQQRAAAGEAPTERADDLGPTRSQADRVSAPSALVASWRQQQQQRPPVQKLARLQQPPPNASLEGELGRPRPLPLPLAPGPRQAEPAPPNDYQRRRKNSLGEEITAILIGFFSEGKYDKRVRPNYSGPPALVNLSFHIIGISSVDEVQMDFTTDFYFRQKWFDPRLKFEPVGEIDELCVGAEFAERIWLPDTFFANEKTATFHKATTENTFIRIGQNGRVYRSIRLTVTCSCPMDLQYFPMDRQRCKIEIESYGYNTRDIDYRWESGDDSVTLNTKIELPQFKILGFKMGQEIQNLSSGDYIRLYCEIHFVRSMGYYLFQIYIPASLIVMISWVSFWLHRNATPARVALGVTTVLTMTTLMSSTNAALPKISYIKSIDVFLGTCFVMVFAALLEYASVGYIGKRIAMKRKRLHDLQQMQQHHQKVCVAAAASAAAAAAAAAQQQHHHQMNGNGGNGGTQTLHRRSVGGQLMQRLMNEGSRTLERTNSTNQQQQQQQQQQQSPALADGIDNGEPNLFGNSTASTTRKASQGRLMNPISPTMLAAGGATPDPVTGKTPLLAAGASGHGASQHHGPATEFEVNQTHDMIRICGLTPSSIDKHSRLVFPICFVCFNLMYWIIYGHISQQIEDKGPLIPFIKN